MSDTLHCFSAVCGRIWGKFWWTSYLELNKKCTKMFPNWSMDSWEKVCPTQLLRAKNTNLNLISQLWTLLKDASTNVEGGEWIFLPTCGRHQRQKSEKCHFSACTRQRRKYLISMQRQSLYFDHEVAWISTFKCGIHATFLRNDKGRRLTGCDAH